MFATTTRLLELSNGALVAPAPASRIRFTLWRVATRASLGNDGRHGLLDGFVELAVRRL